LALALAIACAGLAGCVLPAPSPYMSGEDDDIERRFEGMPVTVIRRGDAVILRMQSDVTFAVDRAEIAPSFAPVLATMAEIIGEHPDATVQITGHADSTGAEAYNEALSHRRAASVGAWLARLGVARERLVMTGEGENAPIASNETEEGRAQNRRVEVMLEPVALAQPPDKP
jgi:outer membrane protein OmpA-like peptidoglycan-associated protein